MTTETAITQTLELYRVSFLSLCCLTVMILLQNFSAAPLAYRNDEQTPGMPLKFDYQRFSFRAVRTYANSVETFHIFACALFLAIAASAPSKLVNSLAIAYVIIRLLYWVVYYAGFGKHLGGLRTSLFVFSQLISLLLASMSFAWLVSKGF